MNRMMKLACNIDIVACRVPRPSTFDCWQERVMLLVTASHGSLGASQIERRWGCVEHASKGDCTRWLCVWAPQILQAFCEEGVTNRLSPDISSPRPTIILMWIDQ
jgi:hypothetical protein